MVFNIFRRKKRKLEQEQRRPEEHFQEEQQSQPYEKKSIEQMSMKKENKKVIEILKNIQDPELEIDIWSLGLIYDLTVKENKVEIAMTFTSPMCPYGPRIIWELEDKIKGINLIPLIELVFNPPWEPTEEVRDMLGL